MSEDTWVKEIFEAWQELIKNYKKIKEQWLKEAIEFADKFPE